MRVILVGIILALAGVGFAAIVAIPSDRDHAAATTPEMLTRFADPPGQGALDGLRFDTRMGPAGKPALIDDFVQFDRGLFMSQECTDRCNYPPSAYFTRGGVNGTAFLVEAFCPTKDTTMVWRGLVSGGEVSGTVTWTTRRFYWTRTQVLEFSGARSDLAADLDIN